MKAFVMILINKLLLQNNIKHFQRPICDQHYHETAYFIFL